MVNIIPHLKQNCVIKHTAKEYMISSIEGNIIGPLF